LTPPNIEGGQELILRLRGTSDAQLAKGISESEGFTLDKEDSHKRGVRSLNRQTFGQIKRCFFWFLCLLALSAGFMYLLWIWVASFVNDPLQVKEFLSSIVWSAALIFATLFFEGIMRDNDR
jgi:hypothetical protein